ncbi:hypothetical protein JOL79_06920 [Microbispora sp. RL4-1S]|uniref:Uncharacterized protein n=1 Tax=Microbispora oryzae TaxID=2806554 RepID=A0A940WL84_9ACTN|nr:hypothetical protein [Microbispora oryzae]MBP2703530.1 hypothetical protein [Microbispora oryzae]
MTRSRPQPLPPLNDVERISARGVITSHYDAQVREAERLLLHAEQAVQTAQAARAAWLASNALPENEAAYIIGAAAGAYSDAAFAHIAGKDVDPDAVNRLRRDLDLVRAYVRHDLGYRFGETP